MGAPREHPQNQWEAQLTDISAALRELSEPWEMGDRIKAAIDRAARRAGLSYWRTFDIWYGKARRIEDYEIKAVVAALAEKKRMETRNELHNLKTRLALLESHLLQVDADFHRETIDQVRQQGRQLGTLDRAGNR